MTQHSAIYKKLGTALYKARENRGISSAEVARRLGGSQNEQTIHRRADYIREIERGLAPRVTLETIEKIAAALGYDIGFAFKDTGTFVPPQEQKRGMYDKRHNTIAG